MAHFKSKNTVTTHTAHELGEALGLTSSDTAEIEFRSDMTAKLISAIQKGNLTHAEIAKRAGTSRTRVTAIAE